MTPDEERNAAVNPAHYKWHPRAESVDVAEFFNFNLGNAIKYIWRSGGPVTKGEIETDLLKAIWYIQREIQRVKNAADR